MSRTKQGNKRERDGFRFWKAVLLAGSVLAALKVIFVDFTPDEEYQVVMAYRRLAGDQLFGAMWEPHQTSAFACVWLMRLFQAVTGGTTGVVLFLRVCTTGVQILLSVWFCRVMKSCLRGEYAFLLGLCYFNIVPKIIQIPEFANLQVWFFTVTVLSLIRYYERRQRLWLLWAGTGMVFEVLAYPPCLLLFPVFLISIFLLSGGRKKDGGNRKRALTDCLVFAGVCAGSALIWLGYVLYHVPPEDFLRNLGYMLSFAPAHEPASVIGSKLANLSAGVGRQEYLLLITAAMGTGAWLLIGYIQERKGESEPHRLSVLAVLLVLAAEGVQVFYWTVPGSGYEMPMIHLLALLLAATLVWRVTGRRKRVLIVGYAGSLVSIGAVICMSDLAPECAISHGMTGALLAAAMVVMGLEAELEEGSRRWIRIFLVSIVLVSVFGKGYTLRGGKTETNSVLGIRSVVKEGPAAGIFTNYMQAYITNSTYEEFQTYVEEGADCLVVTGMEGTAGTSPYLFRNCQICHYSVADPAACDGKLLTYWELYPEKAPDVIVVDCRYGQLNEKEDSWILQYIEKEFGYGRTVDGKYVRYYFK